MPMQDLINETNTMDREYRLWQELCRQLKAVGAVTDADLSAPVKGGPLTPGARLFDPIRTWGEAKAALSAATEAGMRAAARQRARR